MLKTVRSTVNVDQIIGVLPVVNGGTGVTTSTGTGSTVLSASPTLSGDATLSTGNLVIGTSGKGIDFSATPGTGTSELLSDYEEGTWTPSVAAGSGAITTVGAVTGRYTKIGRQVTLSFSVAITNNGTGGSYIQIGNFPFAFNANPSSFTGSGVQNTTGKSLAVVGSGALIYVRLYDATYPASTGEVLYLNLTYNV